VRPRQGCGDGVPGRRRQKFPEAAAQITDDPDVLLEFYNYSAEHWVHPRTTNPIESTFATSAVNVGALVLDGAISLAASTSSIAPPVDGEVSRNCYASAWYPSSWHFTEADHNVIGDQVEDIAVVLDRNRCYDDKSACIT
jgi:hypothetical protein